MSSDARQARAAIAQAGRMAKVPVTLVGEGDRVRVTVPALPADGKAKRAELWVAIVPPEGAADPAACRDCAIVGEGRYRDAGGGRGAYL